MEDIDIVKRVKNGDTEAFSILVEKYYRQLLNFIFRIAGNAEMTEDIGQEVFLNVYKSLENFDENRGTPFSAWLFISARNRCISELRKKRDMKSVALEDVYGLTSDVQTVVDILIEKEQLLAIKTSLEQLPEHYRNIILRSLNGDSILKIAEDEEILPGTVKSRLFRARGKIKILVRDYLGGKGYERI